jgi:hypothetical protein
MQNQFMRTASSDTEFTEPILDDRLKAVSIFAFDSMYIAIAMTDCSS